MRDIIFRAKSKIDGGWVIGSVFHNKEMTEVLIRTATDDYAVNPETVGQYTGLTDKNGKKIFEGDIFVDEESEVTSVVEFRNGMFCLVDYGIRGALTPYGYDESAGGFGECGCLPMDNYCIDEMEIDGNIHDNPELLKGEGKQ